MNKKKGRNGKNEKRIHKTNEEQSRENKQKNEERNGKRAKNAHHRIIDWRDVTAISRLIILITPAVS